MKVYNWNTWEGCKDYFLGIYPPSRPENGSQGQTYSMSQLNTFFFHWQEHKRKCKQLLDEMNKPFKEKYDLAIKEASRKKFKYDSDFLIQEANIKYVNHEFENKNKVLQENNIKNFNDNLNQFLDEFNYTIYV